MTKKEFFELVIKHELGKCSEEEKAILFSYCEKVQTKDKIDEWSLTEIEQSKIKILKRINATIAEHPDRKNKKMMPWKSVAVASIALLFISFTFYLLISKPQTSVIPANAISLKLEDGNIIAIEEGSSQQIMDQEGNVIAEQKRNVLVYNSNGNKEVHQLSIPFGKTFSVRLSDGTEVQLNAGSTMSYLTNFEQEDERLLRLSGEAYLDVAKDTEHPFIVKVATFQLRVFGTQFNIQAYPEDDLDEVVLVEGSVGLYSEDALGEADTSDIFKLEPGYKAVYQKSGGAFSSSQVSTEQYTSWTEGKLVIRNMSFENIMKKLERTYDVQITNKNKALSQEVFNANFGEKPSIEKVLLELKLAFGFSYTIKERRVIIY